MYIPVRELTAAHQITNTALEVFLSKILSDTPSDPPTCDVLWVMGDSISSILNNNKRPRAEQERE